MIFDVKIGGYQLPPGSFVQVTWDDAGESGAEVMALVPGKASTISQAIGPGPNIPIIIAGQVFIGSVYGVVDRLCYSTLLRVRYVYPKLGGEEDE